MELGFSLPLFFSRFLRRHYPDQVMRVTGSFHPDSQLSLPWIVIYLYSYIKTLASVSSRVF